MCGPKEILAPSGSDDPRKSFDKVVFVSFVCGGLLKIRDKANKINFQSPEISGYGR